MYTSKRQLLQNSSHSSLHRSHIDHPDYIDSLITCFETQCTHAMNDIDHNNISSILHYLYELISLDYECIAALLIYELVQRYAPYIDKRPQAKLFEDIAALAHVNTESARRAAFVFFLQNQESDCALLCIGICYYYGIGVEQDIFKGGYYIKLVANDRQRLENFQGSERSQRLEGLQEPERPQGAERSVTRTPINIPAACAQYLLGTGISNDYKHWLYLAARNNHAHAHTLYANAIQRTQRDLAFSYYQRAHELREPEASVRLATLSIQNTLDNVISKFTPRHHYIRQCLLACETFMDAILRNYPDCIELFYRTVCHIIAEQRILNDMYDARSYTGPCSTLNNDNVDNKIYQYLRFIASYPIINPHDHCFAKTRELTHWVVLQAKVEQAICLLYGRGTRVDRVKAVQLMVAAAEMGNEYAIQFMGEAYIRGIRVHEVAPSEHEVAPSAHERHILSEEKLRNRYITVLSEGGVYNRNITASGEEDLRSRFVIVPDKDMARIYYNHAVALMPSGFDAKKSQAKTTFYSINVPPLSYDPVEVLARL